MNIDKRVALSAAAIAALAVTIPASAAQHRPAGGTGHAACADGTVTYDPTNIWPPNHKMQTVNISYVAPADSEGDTTTITVVSISHNQAAADGSGELNGSGNPHEGLDWAGAGNSGSAPEGQAATTTAQVRGERSGTDQAGRTYDIKVMCEEKDSNGMTQMDGTGTADLFVTVPHDQGKH